MGSMKKWRKRNEKMKREGRGIRKRTDNENKEGEDRNKNILTKLNKRISRLYNLKQHGQTIRNVNYKDNICE